MDRRKILQNKVGNYTERTKGNKRVALNRLNKSVQVKETKQKRNWRKKLTVSSESNSENIINDCEKIEGKKQKRKIILLKMFIIAKERENKTNTMEKHYLRERNK